MNRHMPVSAEVSPFEVSMDYFSAMPTHEIEHTQGLVCELELNATPAFRAAEYTGLILVPCLVTEETGAEETLNVIESVRTDAEAVVISANMPENGTELGVAKKNLADIIRHMHSKDVPMSYFMAEYPEGSPIGSVLYDLYNAPLLHATGVMGESMPNLHMTRWDWDTLAVKGDYMLRKNEAYGTTDGLNMMVWPTIRHDRLDPERFPNLNRMLDWYDAYLYISRSAAAAHVTVDAVGFMMSHGIGREVADSEISVMVAAMSAASSTPPLKLKHLGDVTATVSSRRIVKRSVYEDCPVYDGLYVPGDDYKTHRNEGVEHDISDQSYLRQNGWRVISTLHMVGDDEYRAARLEGVGHKDACEAALGCMAAFGSQVMVAIDDLPQTMRAIGGALKTWPKSGLPAGTRRKRPMMKIRNPFPDRRAGGVGVLYGTEVYRASNDSRASR